MGRLLPHLRISPPTGPMPPGRGFYQLEESALYVPIGLADSSPFFSYLESDRIRFDINQKGELLFIEIDAARHTWKVKEDIAPPPDPEQADVRWLDFRAAIADPLLLSNRTRTSLYLRFLDSTPSRTLQIAESVLIQVNDESRLCGVYIAEIVDDLAGHEIALFRASLRKVHS
ncbi:MAG: hypothetical protein WAU88_04900 [Candidatus Zixiibacteriota bacterium]